ncbi:MAG: hypothetical protein ACRDRH_21475 [Pseudonocardia sp.]
MSPAAGATNGWGFETRSVAARGARAHVVIVGQEATLCGLVPTGDLVEGDAELCAACAADWRARGEEPRMVQRIRVIGIQPKPVVVKRGHRP